jgi:small GTP-binding protein
LLRLISIIGPVDSGKTTFLEKLVANKESFENTTTEKIEVFYAPPTKLNLNNYKNKFAYFFLDSPGHSLFTKNRKLILDIGQIVFLVVDINNINFKILDSFFALAINKQIFIILNKIDKFFPAQKNLKRFTLLHNFSSPTYIQKSTQLEEFCIQKGFNPVYFTPNMTLETQQIYLFPISVYNNLGFEDLFFFLDYFFAKTRDTNTKKERIIGSIQKNNQPFYFIKANLDIQKVREDQTGNKFDLTNAELLEKNSHFGIYLLKSEKQLYFGELDKVPERNIYEGPLVFVQHLSQKDTIEDLFLERGWPFPNVRIATSFNAEDKALLSTLTGFANQYIFNITDTKITSPGTEVLNYKKLILFFENFEKKLLEYFTVKIQLRQPPYNLELYLDKYIFRTSSPRIVGCKLLSGVLKKNSPFPLFASEQIQEITKNGQSLNIFQEKNRECAISNKNITLQKGRNIIVNFEGDSKFQSLNNEAKKYSIDILSFY